MTAKSEVSDKIDLLDIGADDYITKPFDFSELDARCGLFYVDIKETINCV